ncbi:unnamed protein product [Dimorphilus gyrociliatus]|uniref:Uncharacterized protein n=1 Tax=Dimorphilus gyrociliatus TaxID=2664684 RepID=A0A7I8W8J0_9ANNE|nr:unnamed protein product [Dimorphilus gyrociliatus]
MKKANRKKGSEIDDVLGRNLLMDDLESLDNRDNEMRRPRLGKLSRGSKDAYLEDYDFEPRYRTPQTPARHKRARSGVWERSMMSTDSLVNSLSGSRKITVSAPDLVHLGVQLTPAQRQAINRSTTLALLRATSRANSKGKIHSIRC